jgi:hypothetical protein
MFGALGIQNALRMRHIVICGLSGYTIPFYVINGTILKKESGFEHKMCVLIFLQLMTETFLIPRETEPDMIKKKCVLVFTLSTRYSCQILIKRSLSTDFRKY